MELIATSCDNTPVHNDGGLALHSSSRRGFEFSINSAYQQIMCAATTAAAAAAPSTVTAAAL
jgi:hypothetical protein